MSGPTSITQFLQQLPIDWLAAGPIGSKDMASQGAVYDGNIQLLREATLARFPDYAPDDAARQAIGGDRGIIQGTESDANYQLRLKDAWGSWSRAGTFVELLAQLYWQGASALYTVQQNGLYYSLQTPLVAGQDPSASVTVGNLSHFNGALVSNQPGGPTIPANTPWWYFDANTGFCSRFVVMLNITPLSTSQQSVIWSIINQWRPGNMTCVQVISTDFSDVLYNSPPDGALAWGGGDVWSLPINTHYYSP